MTDAELEATKADVKIRAFQRAQAFPDPSALQPTKSKKRPAPYLDSLPLSSLVRTGLAQDSVFQALSAEVRVRFLAIERHAASIEGGRFRIELDAAVEAERLAAKTAAEAAQAEMRAAFEAREGDLQRQLPQAQRERDELPASHGKALADARVRLVQSVREVLRPDVQATGEA